MSGRQYDDDHPETVWTLEADTARAESAWEAEHDRSRRQGLTAWDTVHVPGLDLGADRLVFEGPE